jgi:serine/threonine-protein kinase
MSPERARGEAVDKRADIWAFGCVLYEMLTGKQAFTGETTTDILAAVVTKEPDLQKVPPKVRRLLRKCLGRDPRKRLRDIGDASELVEDVGQATAPSRSRPGIVVGVAGVVIGAIALGVAWRATRAVDRPLTRLSVDLGCDCRKLKTLWSAPSNAIPYWPKGSNGSCGCSTI